MAMNLTRENTNMRKLYNYLKIGTYKMIALLGPALFLLGYSGGIYAADDGKSNIPYGILAYFTSTQYYPIMMFLYAIAYMLGFIFIARCFGKLKHLADFRNMMSGQTEVGKALIMFFVGLILLYTPTILVMFSTVLWSQGDLPQSTGLMAQVGMVAKILGMISFIRGWLMLAHSNHAQQQGPSKAITHIIGGVLLFHFWGTVGLLQQTFGISLLPGV